MNNTDNVIRTGKLLDKDIQNRQSIFSTVLVPSPIIITISCFHYLLLNLVRLNLLLTYVRTSLPSQLPPSLPPLSLPTYIPTCSRNISHLPPSLPTCLPGLWKHLCKRPRIRSLRISNTFVSFFLFTIVALINLWQTRWMNVLIHKIPTSTRYVTFKEVNSFL